MSALVDSGRRRSRAGLLWLIPAGGLMLLLAPVVLLAGAGNPPCSPVATPAPGVPAGLGGLGSDGLRAAVGRHPRRRRDRHRP